MKTTLKTLSSLLTLVLAVSAFAIDVWEGPPPGTMFEHWTFSDPISLYPESAVPVNHQP